jgi:regulator of RNase E activity RraA
VPASQGPENKLFATSTVSDVLDSLGIDGGIVNGLRPVRPGLRVRGIARVGVVVDSSAPGIDGLSELLDGAAEGSFLMLAWSANLRASVFGGLAAHRARLQGCVGLAVDGCVRDLDELATRLPVWFQSGTPRTGRGRLGIRIAEYPVNVGGAQVARGDTVFADETGLVIVKAADVSRVTEAAEALEVQDLEAERQLLSGGTFKAAQPIIQAPPLGQ